MQSQKLMDFQMLHQKQIKELMGKGKVDMRIAEIIFEMMYYLHQPFSEIMKMPIPLVESLRDCLNKTKKEEAKAYK